MSDSAERRSNAPELWIFSASSRNLSPTTIASSSSTTNTRPFIVVLQWETEHRMYRRAKRRKPLRKQPVRSVPAMSSRVRKAESVQKPATLRLGLREAGFHGQQELAVVERLRDDGER